MLKTLVKMGNAGDLFTEKELSEIFLEKYQTALDKYTKKLKSKK